MRTDGRSEARTLTGRGRWGDGEARTPRHPAPPPGLRPCLRTVGTAALGWPLSAGAEGTGPPKGSVWSVSEETRQPRPGHGVSYDGIKSPVFFLSVLNVRTHKRLVFKLSSYRKLVSLEKTDFIGQVRPLGQTVKPAPSPSPDEALRHRRGQGRESGGPGRKAARLACPPCPDPAQRRGRSPAAAGSGARAVPQTMPTVRPARRRLGLSGGTATCPVVGSRTTSPAAAAAACGHQRTDGSARQTHARSPAHAAAAVCARGTRTGRGCTREGMFLISC